ncbi:vWA-like protein [Neoconidiobolus thromboides FSU 785]|nr:vWA-like protein [Neoconidiobolus thromboides FSU 785]
MWRKYEMMTNDLALNLSEQLRLILEPTLATKLKGDYRTGKRLNMKKIIPYIASQFKKDKIWLRRTKPSQRQYQVMLAVDDSKSMGNPSTVQLTFESLALVTKALNQLEVGKLAIVSFGEKVNLLHSFDMPMTNDMGNQVIHQFSFNQQQTDLKKMLQTTLDYFEQSKGLAGNNEDLWQLQLILSDGICESHDQLKALLRRAEELRVMVIFIVLDTKPNVSESILNIQNVNYITNQDGQMTLSMNKYLDSFPFRFYTILKDVHSLPHVLADALRQYFSLVKE